MNKRSISLWNYVEDIVIDTVPEPCGCEEKTREGFKHFSNTISQCVKDETSIVLDTNLGTICIPASFLRNTIVRMTIHNEWDDKVNDSFKE